MRVRRARFPRVAAWCLGAAFALAVGAAADNGTGSERPAPAREAKEVSREVGHATRDAAKTVGHATRDFTREIGHAFRRLGKKLFD